MGFIIIEERGINVDDLHRKFYKGMREIYIKADKELGYKATRYLQMLSRSTNGGVDTAISLVTRSAITEGLWTLAQNGRLDLSVETLVLKEEFKSLFREEIRSICSERLDEVRKMSQK